MATAKTNFKMRQSLALKHNQERIRLQEEQIKRLEKQLNQDSTVRPNSRIGENEQIEDEE